MFFHIHSAEYNMENKSSKKRQKKDKTNIETDDNRDSQVFVKRDDSFTIPEANIAVNNSFNASANLETDASVNANLSPELTTPHLEVSQDTPKIGCSGDAVISSVPNGVDSSL